MNPTADKSTRPYTSLFEIPGSYAEEVVEPKSFRNTLISALGYTAIGLMQVQQFQSAMDHTLSHNTSGAKQPLTSQAPRNCQSLPLLNADVGQGRNRIVLFSSRRTVCKAIWADGHVSVRLARRYKKTCFL